MDLRRENWMWVLARQGLLFMALMTCACQAPTMRMGGAGGNALNLTFLVAGSGTNSRAATQARLLVPSVRTLTVNLTTDDPTLSVVPPQTVPVASGAGQVSVQFQNVKVGTYQVMAQGFDAAGTLQFQQSSSLNLVNYQDNNVTLNLVPANVGGLPQLTSGVLTPTNAASLNAGQALSWVVPSSSVSDGYYLLQTLELGSGIQCYFQNADGTNLVAFQVGGLYSIQPDKAGQSFVTLYNSNSVAENYQLLLNPTGAITVTPGAILVSLTAYGSLTFSQDAFTTTLGAPVVFSGTSSVAGASNWQWFVNGTLSGNSSSFTFTPTTAGTYTVYVTVVSGGVTYNGSGTVTVSNTIPRNGLVAEWLFSDAGSTTPADTSPSGYTLGVVGGATAAEDRHGSASSADMLSTGSASIVSGVAPSLSFAYNAPFSVSLWFNVDASVIGTSWPYIAGRIGSPGEYNYFLAVNTNKLSANVGVNSSGSNSVECPLTAGGWHHAAMIYDGATLTLYMDAINRGSTPYSYGPALPPTSSGFALGGHGYVGFIDDCRVYSRVLTISEVLALYNE